jgi:hypothetical protein
MTNTITGNRRLRFLLSLTGLLCLLFATPNVRADEPPATTPPDDAADANTPDPPSRVARISYLDGTVSLQPGGTGDWGAAARNRPVTIGDKLWTDKDSRAELQAGQASIHLGSMTALSFLNLDDNVIQMRVAEGSVNFRVRELREGDVYELDTPNLAFTVKEAGAFRVDINENGDITQVTAIRGEGEVTAGGRTYAVHAGERAQFDGVDNPQYSTSAAPAPDMLDQWSQERDLREDNSTSARYVSRETPGYEDLDNNGTWSEQPDYGPVWYPTVPYYGWAPYSWGYWNWVGPWGWTWIGYEPWGFAPYHYGRWAYISGRWGWCPGPIYARPFYGPAFVGFLGGPRFGIGFGFGAGFGVGVGWFPLGFHEPYYPGFRASRLYINNINVHNTVIRNTSVLSAGHTNFNYAYAHNANAVTVASHNAFVNGSLINRGTARVSEASLRGAQVGNRASFAPGRQSSFGAANSGARIATPSLAVQNRSVMARNTPSAAAAHSAFRTMNTNGLTAGRVNSSINNGNRGFTGNRSTVNNSAITSSRQNQLATNRPSSVNGAANNRATVGGNTSRTWEAQGNVTDRGHAPQGFGANRPANAPAQTARTTRSDRPPWAGTGSTGMAGRGNVPSFNNGRSYEPAARTYSAPSRSYSAPRSNYPSSRTYSAPSRTYSAPSRGGYSAPRSSGGGGGASRGGGGGSHGGGGVSRGGGGRH